MTGFTDGTPGPFKVTLFLEGTGRANGMIFDREGNLIAAADMHGELWKIRPDGSHKVLVDNYQGKLLNGPNDVWINPINGGIYITDPIFPRPYWDAGDPRQQPWEPTHSEQSPQGKGGHVYYLPSGGRKLVRVTSDALGWESDSWPNGVVGTPDGKKLYVNKWYYDNKGGTWVFDIKRDGTLTNMRKFTDWGGDGMSMDERGQRLHQQWRGCDGVRSRRQQHPEDSHRPAGQPTTRSPGAMARRCSSPVPSTG